MSAVPNNTYTLKHILNMEKNEKSRVIFFINGAFEKGETGFSVRGLPASETSSNTSEEKASTCDEIRWEKLLSSKKLSKLCRWKILNYSEIRAFSHFSSRIAERKRNCCLILTWFSILLRRLSWERKCSWVWKLLNGAVLKVKM